MDMRTQTPEQLRAVVETAYKKAEEDLRYAAERAAADLRTAVQTAEAAALVPHSQSLEEILRRALLAEITAFEVVEDWAPMNAEASIPRGAFTQNRLAVGPNVKPTVVHRVVVTLETENGSIPFRIHGPIRMTPPELGRHRLAVLIVPADPPTVPEKTAE